MRRCPYLILYLTTISGSALLLGCRGPDPASPGAGGEADAGIASLVVVEPEVPGAARLVARMEALAAALPAEALRARRAGAAAMGAAATGAAATGAAATGAIERDGA